MIMNFKFSESQDYSRVRNLASLVFLKCLSNPTICRLKPAPPPPPPQPDVKKPDPECESLKAELKSKLAELEKEVSFINLLAFFADLMT